MGQQLFQELAVDLDLTDIPVEVYIQTGRSGKSLVQLKVHGIIVASIRCDTKDLKF
jgi:hypothetical protein